MVVIRHVHLYSLVFTLESHMERRQKIDNRSDKLLMVFTEPEAQDFWLKPGDEFEIRAPITDSDAMFEIALHEDGITVYPPHEMGYVSRAIAP